MKAIILPSIRKTSGTLLTAISAFMVYCCMYGFRKPFTTGDYEGIIFLGVHFKIWLVIAQTIGYTLSKFAGISFISSMNRENRGKRILILTVLSWTALFFFGIFPAPYNIIFIFLNGLPLGMIYGLVFSYIEGRKTTEFLGAVLASSFIFASGIAQTIGKLIIVDWGINEFWMPWFAGLLFFPVLTLFTAILESTPDPSISDQKARNQRLPMSRRERRKFISRFLPGIFMLVMAYILLTIIRDYRSNFASNIWKDLGHQNDPSLFSSTEIPVSILVLIVMALLGLVRSNRKAFFINLIVILVGFLLSILTMILFKNEYIGPYWWFTLTGMGLYMSYVPFNCMLFERFIAGSKMTGNAGFIIYVADSFGYLGSNLILIIKNFAASQFSYSIFFEKMFPVFSFVGFVLVLLSLIYFYPRFGIAKKNKRWFYV